MAPRRHVRARRRASEPSGWHSRALLFVCAHNQVSLDEAIERCQLFREIGADITHIAGLKDIDACRRYCDEVSGPKMHNNNSAAFVVAPEVLQELGFALAIYPDLLLGSSIRAMNEALALLKEGGDTSSVAQPFALTKDAMSFDEYDREQERYTEIQERFRNGD